ILKPSAATSPSSSACPVQPMFIARWYDPQPETCRPPGKKACSDCSAKPAEVSQRGKPQLKVFTAGWLGVIGFRQGNAILLSDSSHAFVDGLLLFHGHRRSNLAGWPKLPQELCPARKLCQLGAQLVFCQRAILQDRKCRLIFREPKGTNQCRAFVPRFDPAFN